MNKRFAVWVLAVAFAMAQSMAFAQDAKVAGESPVRSTVGTIEIADNDRYVEPATPEKAVDSADGGLTALQWGAIAGTAAAIVAVLSMGGGSGSSGPTGTH